MSNSPSRVIPVENSHSGGAVSTQLVHTEKATYTWVMAEQVAGANKVFFDLFNAHATKLVRLLSIRAVAALDVAVTITVGVRLHLVRTSDIGTGGTAWDTTPTTLDAAGGGVSKHDTTNPDMDAAITGRQVPSGGGTLEAWLNSRYMALDKDGAPLTVEIEMLPDFKYGQPFVLRQNEGVKVIQGSVASAGEVMFIVTFTVE